MSGASMIGASMTGASMTGASMSRPYDGVDRTHVFDTLG